MYEILTAELNESYTEIGSGVHVIRIRYVELAVISYCECTRIIGRAVCIKCADSWHIDYEFPVPFPFERVKAWSLRDLIGVGRLGVGHGLTMPGTSIKAVVTSTGGLMPLEGRVLENPVAADNAVIDQRHPMASAFSGKVGLVMDWWGDRGSAGEPEVFVRRCPSRAGP
ncbi:hypothetical protein [Nocardia sp. CA-135398]|uniref:hypothetical protein n=1 Tax=Nocardia sp. CA-135398 TaxID=3239977 RepID=UPI003D99EAD7